MTSKIEFAVIVLGDNYSKIAFGNHAATYDLGGKLKSVVNPTGNIEFPKHLEVLDFRNGHKPSIKTHHIPPGLFL